jgi:hypothetical protein
LWRYNRAEATEMLKAAVTPALRVAFFLFLLTPIAFPQSAELGENCDLSVLGASETKTFLGFDRELRYALSKQDAGIMALLVKYPFRINDDHGSYYLEDAGSLQARFSEIFTPAVRDTILKQRPETVSCVATGIMYGDGVIWVNSTGQRYAIETVNLPSESRPQKSATGELKFVCNADKHRVIVDLGANGVPRYRAWNKPHPLTDEPDIEIPKGKWKSEGSGLCSHSLWTFASGAATFTVGELEACYEDSHQPPADAKGTLDVSIPGKPIVTWWCR